MLKGLPGDPITDTRVSTKFRCRTAGKDTVTPFRAGWTFDAPVDGVCEGYQRP